MTIAGSRPCPRSLPVQPKGDQGRGQQVSLKPFEPGIRTVFVGRALARFLSQAERQVPVGHVGEHAPRLGRASVVPSFMAMLNITTAIAVERLRSTLPTWPQSRRFA